MNDDSPRWSTRREALRVVLYRPHLYKTLRIALVDDVGALAETAPLGLELERSEIRLVDGVTHGS